MLERVDHLKKLPTDAQIKALVRVLSSQRKKLESEILPKAVLIEKWMKKGGF